MLHAAVALVLTSFGQGEAAPVTVLEAMACGLPVVCSRIGGTPDMITDGVDGFLVDQHDIVGIAACMSQLIADPDLAQRIGQPARETALARINRRLNAHALLDRIRRRR